MSPPNDPSLDEASSALPLQSIVSLNNTETETTPFVAENIRVKPETRSTQPKPLKPRKLMEAALDLYDGMLGAISVALIIKTTLCIVANRREEVRGARFGLQHTASLTLSLLKVNEPLVTAFTIIFVTILSTFVKRLALFKAQEGARLIDLEQLQASTSLPSTINMIFSMRKFGKFSSALLIPWCFYYIGSQASQREYLLVNLDPFHNLMAIYPNDNLTSDFDDGKVSSTYVRSYAMDYYAAYYETTGDSDLYQRGVDIAGYALIPDTYGLLEPQGALKVGEWVDAQTAYGGSWVGWSGMPITYSSPSGKRSWSQSGFRGHYTMNTSYLEVECEEVKMREAEDFPQGATRSVSLNMTTSDSARHATEVRRFELWTKWNASDWSDAIPDPLPSINGSDIAVASMLCNITRPRIELQIKCSQTICPVQKMRFLPIDEATLYRTPLDDDHWASIFFHMLLTMDPPPDPTDPAPRVTNIDCNIGLGWDLNQLANASINDFPATNPLYQFLGYSVPDILNSGHFDLTAAFNTWYIISKGNWLSPIYATFDDVSATTGPNAQYEYIQAYGAPWNPHYHLSWSWIVADYISGAILLAASVASFWLRKHTLAPDILGYVSSLTRDNPHFTAPEVGSTLSGVQRAMQMQDVSIKIGDVECDGSYGRVSIVPPLHGDVQGLRKDRKYL